MTSSQKRSAEELELPPESRTDDFRAQEQAVELMADIFDINKAIDASLGIADPFELEDSREEKERKAQEALDAAFEQSLAADTESAAVRSTIEALEGPKPDQVAKDEALAQKMGVPPVAVADDTREELTKLATVEEIRAIIAGSQPLGKALGNPAFAAKAHDDLEALSAVDRVANGFRRGRELHALGIAGLQLMRTRSAAAQARVDEIQGRLDKLGHDDEGFVSWLASASEVIGQMLEGLDKPGLAIRVGGGAAAGAGLGLAGGIFAPVTSTVGALTGAGTGFLAHIAADSFEVEAGLSYLEQLDKGIDPNVAKWTAIGVGILNAALEVGAATVLLKPFAAAGKKMLKVALGKAVETEAVKAAALQAAKAYGAGVGAEVGTEVLQEINNIAGEEIGKYLSEEDFESVTFDEATDRLTEIAVKTFKAMVFLAAPGPGANYTVTKVQARKAKKDAETAKAMRTELTKSLLLERSPDVAIEYAAEVLRDKGIEEVFIPFDVLVALSEQLDTDLLGALEEGDQLREPAMTGGNVRLTAEQYVEHILLPDIFEDIAGDVRYSDEGMTENEATEFEGVGPESEEGLDEALAAFNALGTDEEQGITELGGDEAAVVAQEQAAEEELVSATVVQAEGRIFRGRQHGDAVVQAEEALGRPLTTEEFEQSGDLFVTTTGRLINRAEAVEINKRTGKSEMTGPFEGEVQEQVTSREGERKTQASLQREEEIVQEIERLRDAIFGASGKVAEENQAAIAELQRELESIKTANQVTSREVVVRDERLDLGPVQEQAAEPIPVAGEVTEPSADGEPVTRIAFHGTREDTLPTKVGFGGLHVGTSAAAQQRLDETPSKRKGGKPGAEKVLRVQITLEKPFGSEQNPISENDLFTILNLPDEPGGLNDLKAQGFDGIIYENSVEDRGSISYLAFNRESVVEEQEQAAEPVTGRDVDASDMPAAVANAPIVTLEEATDRFPTTKIVNNDGTPMLVFHGTGRTFTRFELLTDRPGGAFYFTQSPRAAWNYSGIENAPVGERRTIATYLDVQNPLVIEDSSPEAEAATTITKERAMEFKRQGFDGIIIVRTRDIRPAKPGQKPEGEPAAGDAIGDFSEIAVFDADQILVAEEPIVGAPRPEPRAQEQVTSREVSQSPDPDTAIAEDQLGLKAFFATGAEAGMTPSQFEKYLVALERAANAGATKMKEKRLRRKKRQLTKEVKKERAILREEVAERVQQEPVYEILGKIGLDRLNREAVVALLPNGAEQLKELPKSNRRVIYERNGTMDPDAIADVHGFFPDGRSMLFAMIDAGPLQEAIDAQTDKEMLTRNSSLLDEMSETEAALESVHTDERAAVMLMEVNQMRAAQKEKALTAKVLKAYVRQQLQTKLTGDIKPSTFLAEQRRQGRLAGKLLRQGDRAGALKAKFRQLVNFEFAKEAYAVQRKVKKQQRFLNKFLRKRKKNSSIPENHYNAIQELVNGFLLGPRASEATRVDLLAYAEAQAAEQGIAVEIPQRLLDEDQKIHVSEMTLGEWTMLVETVKEMETKARDENKLRRSEARNSRLATVLPIAQRVRDNLTARVRRPGKPEVEQVTKASTAESLANRIAKVRKDLGPDFATILLNADSLLREIDGFQELGPAYRAIKGGIDRAMVEGYTKDQVGFVERQKVESERMVELFAVYSKTERLAMWQSRYIPGVSKSLTHFETISVLLNMGNAENIQALIDSGQFTEDELMSIRQSASKKDLDFAQSVWTYMKEFWPEVSAATLKRDGFTPTQVEALAFEHSEHGSYEGGYFPLQYDRQEAVLPRQGKTQSYQDQVRFGSHARSHTARGHTLARTDSGGLPVKLDPFVINAHVDQVIYDLEMGDAVTDAYKVLHHPQMTKAFAEMGQIEIHEALALWLDDVTTGEIHMSGIVEHGFRHLRTGIIAHSLGFNALVAGLQPLGIFQSAALIGKANVARGVLAVITSSPVGQQNIWKTVAAENPEMRQRERTFHKDITDAKRAFANGWLARVTPGETAAWVGDALFYFIVKMQRVADMITYLGAKHKGLQLFKGNEAKAIQYAGRMVIRSQASGMFQERTAIERGTINPRVRQTEVVRSFSLFLSFFAAKMNVAWERTRKLNYKSPVQLLHYTVDMMLLFVFETALALLIRGRWPDDDDDIPEVLAKEGVATFAQGIPIVRESFSAARGFPGGGVVGASSDAFGGLAEQVDQGELDEAAVRSAAKALGIFTKLPLSRIQNIGDATFRALDGEEVEIFEMLGGRQFKK